jgi:hypothetical protein
MTIEEDCKLLLGVDGLNRAELLVAWFELVLRHRSEIRKVVEQETFLKPMAAIVDELGKLLPSGVLDLWSGPGKAFQGRLQELRDRLGEDHQREALPILARGVLQALDESLGRAGERKLPPCPVAASFFRREPFWIVPQSPACRPPWWGLERRLSGLSPLRWLSSVRVIPGNPGGELRLAALPYEIDRWLDPVKKEKAVLRFGVSPLARDLPHMNMPVGETLSFGGKRFSVYRVVEKEEELGRLERLLCDKILPACIEHKVSVLLLPELTLGPELRSVLARVLNEREKDRVRKAPASPPCPVLIVAGSCHEESEKGYVNRSTVLNFRGKTVELSGSGLWRHDKVERYVFETGTLQDRGVLKEVSSGMGLDQPGVDGGAEPQALGDGFTLVSSRLGQICVAICIDYLKNCSGWRDEVQGGWTDWFWVPSATLRGSDFGHVARHLALAGTGTIAVNSCWLPASLKTWQKDWWGGLAHLPESFGRWQGHNGREVPGKSCTDSAHGCPEGGEGCLFLFEVNPPGSWAVPAFS